MYKAKETLEFLNLQIDVNENDFDLLKNFYVTFVTYLSKTEFDTK